MILLLQRSREDDHLLARHLAAPGLRDRLPGVPADDERVELLEQPAKYPISGRDTISSSSHDGRRLLMPSDGSRRQRIEPFDGLPYPASRVEARRHAVPVGASVRPPRRRSRRSCCRSTRSHRGSASKMSGRDESRHRARRGSLGESLFSVYSSDERGSPFVPVHAQHVVRADSLHAERPRKPHSAEKLVIRVV